MTPARVGLQKRNPSLEEPFVMVFKQTCFLTQKEKLSLSSRSVRHADILEKMVRGVEGTVEEA